MAQGDIFSLSLEQVKELYFKYSKVSRKWLKNTSNILGGQREMIPSGNISKGDLNDMLTTIKEDILTKVTTYLKNLSTKFESKGQEPPLAIFCPTCKKRHGLNECLLNTVEVCWVCGEKDHDEKNYP